MKRTNKSAVAERPSKLNDADGDISELTPVEDDDTPDGALPRPPKLGKDVERNLIPNLPCPECGYAVTKQRLNGVNYRVCTGNYNDPSLCSWHQELDKDGNPVSVKQEDW